jgi:hypothetical protein
MGQAIGQVLSLAVGVALRLSRVSGEVKRSDNRSAPGRRAHAAETMRRFSRRVDARPYPCRL